jgi:hypothetical protein
MSKKSGGRQYKNVYTILEKVKKGEIETFYDKSESLFSKLDFYKRPDLAKPYLHYLDESRLDDVVKTHLWNDKVLRITYDEIKHKIQGVDRSTFITKFYDNVGKVPQHMSYDIFKLYYNKMERLEFSERTKENAGKYKFLEKANSPVGKIMTEGSNLKSAIFTRNILFHFILSLTIQQLQNEDDQLDMDDLLNNPNFDSSSSDVHDKLDSTLSQQVLEDALKESTELCKSLDEVTDNETQQMLYETVNDSKDGADKLSVEYIKKASESLKTIKMSMSSLKDRIKKLMDKTTSYFSAKKEDIIEDIFNSDNIAGIDDYISLHPKLRKILIEDVVVKETKSIGKIDIYIDISGSMTSRLNRKDDYENSISRIDFAKSFALKMQDQDLLNDVYIFDTRVKKYKKDEFSLAVLDANGGTNITKVIETIKNNGNNALIITDAEDYCGLYSEKAFFIGVEGARFHHFEPKTRHRYINNGQIIVFDGVKTYNVNQEGFVIK